MIDSVIGAVLLANGASAYLHFDLRWDSPNYPSLTDALNIRYTVDNMIDRRPGAYYPSVALALINWVIETNPGSKVIQQPKPPETKPGVVY